jgi:hypothetical protein
VHRILTDRRNRATLREIETHWSLEDLLDAHMAIDLREELEHEARERAKEMRERRKNHRGST